MLVSTPGSAVSATAAIPSRSRSNRPTSSAATCCASDALPPLPNTSSLPPACSADEIAAAASRIGPVSPSLTCSCRAIVSAKVAMSSACPAVIFDATPRCTSLPDQTIFHDVGPELLLADLQRRGGLGRHADLHRVVLAQRKSLPVFRHQQAARVGM